MLHSNIASIRITRAVRKEKTIKFELIKVIIPRHTNNLYSAANKATNNIVLYATIEQDHFLGILQTFLPIGDYFFARNLIHEVDTFIGSFRQIVRFVIKNNLPHHYTMFAQTFREGTSVYSRDAGNMLSFQPFSKTLMSVPMAVSFAIIAHNNGRCINTVRLHEGCQAIGFHRKSRYTIIADKRIRKSHQLASIRRIGKTLGIAHHGCIKHHLTRYRLFVAK